MLNILIMEQKMKYSALWLFLAIFQLDGMEVKKDGKRIHDDLMELVALIGKKKKKRREPDSLSAHVSGITSMPTTSVIEPVASLTVRRGYHTDFSEAYGIKFERIKNAPGERCKYICLECSKIVTNHKPHAIGHSAQRPYVCDCGNSYKQSGHLATHKKTCSGNRSQQKKAAPQGVLDLLYSESEEFSEKEDEKD